MDLHLVLRQYSRFYRWSELSNCDQHTRQYDRDQNPEQSNSSFVFDQIESELTRIVSHRNSIHCSNRAGMCPYEYLRSILASSKPNLRNWSRKSRLRIHSRDLNTIMYGFVLCLRHSKWNMDDTDWLRSERWYRRPDSCWYLYDTRVCILRMFLRTRIIWPGSYRPLQSANNSDAKRNSGHHVLCR